MPSIYLDYNATTPLRSEVIAVMTDVLSEAGNASSVHKMGRAAKAHLEKARASIATQINCRAQMVTFTGGGTEANGLALRASGAKRLILGATEHDSVLAAGAKMPVDLVGVDEDGLVDMTQLQTLLDQNTDDTLVSIMLANNETGVLQDIKTIAQMARGAGALIHTDAIQAFGKIPLDYSDLGVDMLSLSAHKMGGPQGVGALVARESLSIHPLYGGGGQEVGRRAGTENVAAIAGFGKAAELVGSMEAVEAVKAMRDGLEERLAAHAPQVKFYGANSPRLPNVTTILMPGVSSEIQVMAFDLEAICVSAGSACSSGKVKASHVITAMGADKTDASCTVRVSLGWNSRQEDVDRFCEIWIRLYDRKSGAGV